MLVKTASHCDGRVPQVTRVTTLFFGSSLNSGESLFDFQEEVLVISESECHSFDNFDLVVDAF